MRIPKARIYKCFTTQCWKLSKPLNNKIVHFSCRCIRLSNTAVLKVINEGTAKLISFIFSFICTQFSMLCWVEKWWTYSCLDDHKPACSCSQNSSYCFKYTQVEKVYKLPNINQSNLTFPSRTDIFAGTKNHLSLQIGLTEVPLCPMTCGSRENLHILHPREKAQAFLMYISASHLLYIKNQIA